MKIKKSWLFFIPILFLTVGLSLYQVLVVNNGVNKSFFDGGIASIVFVASIVILFAVLFLLSATDKVTSGNYLINKNPIAGIFSIVTGALIVIQSITLFSEFFASFSSGVDFLDLTNAILSLIAGFTFAMIGISSITGKNFLIKSSALIIFPTLWATVQIFVIFMGYAAVSVHAVNMLDLVCMVFATLFILNMSMLYANIKSDNALKSCFVFGMSAIATTFSYAASSISSEIVLSGSFNIMNNIKLISYITLALFILFFLIELSKNGQTIEESEKLSASLYDYLDEDGYIIDDEEQSNKSTNVSDTLNHVDSIINETSK